MTGEMKPSGSNIWATSDNMCLFVIDFWRVAGWHVNLKRSSPGCHLNPSIFVAQSSSITSSDKSLFESTACINSMLLECHFASGNPPAWHSSFNWNAFSCSSLILSAPPKMSSTYLPWVNDETAKGNLCPSSSASWRSDRTAQNGAAFVP